MTPRLPIALMLSALLAACTGVQRDPGFAPVRPSAAAAPAPNPGAIYQPGREMALFEDRRARRVGDLLTIRLVEATSASTKASTNTKKENTVDIPAPSLFGSAVTFNAPGFIPLASNRNNTLGASLESAQKFTGSGDSSQGNSLSGSVTVTVAEVLANGNLAVRGEKIVRLNQGSEAIRIAGIVRPQDIQPDNSVYSTQVADAYISYNGEGAMADANQMGWLARFFNSPYWPF
jgi:flagellar L-ring protein precursor FlgH